MQVTMCQTATNPSLFSAAGVVGLIFLVTIAVTVSGAIIATTAKRLVRAVAGLAVCFTGLAGIYYFLMSPFLAMMQMLIYVGAVSILIAFAIMLAEPEEKQGAAVKGAPFAGPLGFAVGAFAFAGLSVMGLSTQWQGFSRRASGDIKHIGDVLLTSHSMVFELISLVLLIAIIGALVLARKGRSRT